MAPKYQECIFRRNSSLPESSFSISTSCPYIVLSIMTDSKPVTGGCECGRVRYSARRVSSSSTSALCYCKQCQRISGSAFLAFVDFKKKDIEWTTPPDSFKSSENAQRDFCKVCGSSIAMRYHFQEDSLGINLGTLDIGCDFVPETQCHIFVKDKPAWYQIPDDGKPRHDRFDNDGKYEDGMRRWREERQRSEQQAK